MVLALGRGAMTIYLDHTIVPSKDKEKAARFFARALSR
jgi:hypothetical protein